MKPRLALVRRFRSAFIEYAHRTPIRNPFETAPRRPRRGAVVCRQSQAGQARPRARRRAARLTERIMMFILHAFPFPNKRPGLSGSTHVRIRIRRTTETRSPGGMKRKVSLSPAPAPASWVDHDRFAVGLRPTRRRASARYCESRSGIDCPRAHSFCRRSRLLRIANGSRRRSRARGEPAPLHVMRRGYAAVR